MKSIIFSVRWEGGIKEVRLLEHKASEDGEKCIVLNAEGKAPVLAIGRGTKEPILTSFEETAKDSRSITYKGEITPGVVLEKTFRIPEGDEVDEHLIDVGLQIRNTGNVAIELGDYFAYLGAASPLQRTEWIKPAFFWQDSGEAEQKDAGKFDGSGFLFMKFSSARTEIVESVAEADWAGTMNQFYSILMRPLEVKSAKIWGRNFPSNLEQEEEAGSADSSSAPKAVQAGLSLGEYRLNPGESKDLSYELYAGPKEYRRLARLGEGRENAMFYGFFSPISKFLMWLSSFIHDYVPNWGWSIVIMTIIIRIAIWPLHAKSQRTMKRMSLLQPKMAEIREKHQSDPQKMNVEVMKLYKDYGVNPMGGCFPIFFQIPIFFGFYRMLQSAAELRGAGWFWTDDLSMPDTVATIAGFPLNPLPLLMGITMFIQMSVAPKTGDKMQQRIFMFMPLIFLVFCYNFASALALYWTTQNIFSIFQTWHAQTQPDPVLEKAAAKRGGSAPARKKPSKGLGGLPMAASSEGDNQSKKKKKRGPRTGG